MASRLEHANISVRDLDVMVRFLQTAFPEFRVRGRGVARNGDTWLHIGTDEHYIALLGMKSPTGKTHPLYGGEGGVNHLAYEVDDVAAVRDRLLAIGCRDATPPNNHPCRKRVYIHDPEGNEWEFIQYLTDDPAKRHDYTLPDG